MRRASSFSESDDGAAAAEFAIISIILVVFLLGTIDFARYAWQLNSVKAATRAGARKAVVTAPAASTLVDYHATGYGSGVTVPANATGVGPFECTFTTSGSCGLSGYEDVNFTKIYTAMKLYYNPLQKRNVSVRYEHIGIGISGNPCAPDVEPMVTVKVTGLTFSPIALRIFGITLPMPPSQTTLTGEALGVMSCS